MADAQLRDLERRIRAGEPIDAQALVAALLRAGAHDPRRHPRRGDVVESPGEGFGRYRPRRWEITEWPVVQTVWAGANLPGQQVIKSLVRRRRVDAALAPVEVGATQLIYLRSWRRWARDGRILRIACGECHGLGFAASVVPGSGFPTCHPCAGTGWALSPELEVHAA